MGFLFSRQKDPKLQKAEEYLIEELQSLERKVQDLSRQVTKSEGILQKRRRGEDSDQTSKQSKGSVKLLFKKYLAGVDRNLNELGIAINKIKEENLNLNRDITIKHREMHDLKQKESDFRETCVRALMQLDRQQIGGFNFIEGEPHTYTVAFNDGIKNLMDELNKNKKENNDLLQYKTQQGNEITNLQMQLRNLEQKNSLLQNQNQQLQLTLEEVCKREESNSHLQIENEFNQLKRVENAKQEQCDGSDEILHLLSRISEYEEQLKTRDISAINTKLQELNKSLGKSYGKEIRNLNLEILKLLQTLKDDQLNKQHEVFKRAMNLKTETLERVQKHCYLLNPEDLRKKFRNRLSEDVRAIEDELKTFRQIILDFPSIEEQRRTAYKDIVSALTSEYTHLKNLTSSKNSSPKTESLVSFHLPENDVALESPYVKETLTRLVEINRSTRELEEGVDKFRGSKTDKIFLDLEHKLVGNITLVDKIQVNGSEVIRDKRYEAIKYVQECLGKLNNNVINI